MGLAKTPQLYALAVYGGAEDTPYTGASQLYALGVYDGLPIAPYARAAQLYALAVYNEEPSPFVRNAMFSQLYALAVYGEGAPEDFRLRAWSFTMDGHKFYVLKLGELGTYICDTTNGNNWYKWETAGYNYWNAVLGLNWNGRVLAASVTENIIWEVKPEVWNDEGFKDIVHVSTAILNQTGREYISHDELRLSVSSGFNDSLNPRITLEYSDDRGVTYETATDGTIVLTDDDFKQEVEWISLGSFTAPGRVIRITDVGGPLRIDYATVKLDGEE